MGDPFWLRWKNEKNLPYPLDKADKLCYTTSIQTDEAEITEKMLPQRACVAESQVKNNSSS